MISKIYHNSRQSRRSWNKLQADPLGVTSKFHSKVMMDQHLLLQVQFPLSLLDKVLNQNLVMLNSCKNKWTSTLRKQKRWLGIPQVKEQSEAQKLLPKLRLQLQRLCDLLFHGKVMRLVDRFDGKSINQRIVDRRVRPRTDR